MSLQIVWKGCALGNWQTGRPGCKPDAIVIHLMDGSLEGTDEWFNTEPERRNNGGHASSAHYGIGKDGTIHQYVYDQHRAFHAGCVDHPTASMVLARPHINPNLWTIGIEHEGRMTDVGPWPEAQLDASARLIAAVATKWAISLDRDHVFGHHEVFALKPCPGPNVDLDDLIKRAASYVAAQNVQNAGIPPAES